MRQETVVKEKRQSTPLRVGFGCLEEDRGPLDQAVWEVKTKYFPKFFSVNHVKVRARAAA